MLDDPKMMKISLIQMLYEKMNKRRKTHATHVCPAKITKNLGGHSSEGMTN